MFDAVQGNRPERRSALITRELSRLNVDIATLSDVHFLGEGSLPEHGVGYTFFCLRKRATDGRISGLGCMVSIFIADRLENQPTSHYDCMMSMCLPLKNNQYVTLFNVYAPTLQAEPAEKKNKFYSELRSLLQSTFADDNCDFFARVGQDAVAWKGVLGTHGIGNCNGNGRMLLEICTE
ncbi:unnamed protein product [Acanthosepion pharaonis]|uniref:Uncharacterized protein n=1 Tax=Acanthosepion pharaonis TaxID=158019 RepID=A0A812C711_ACAPH|nr:unnamed protein product [Sepia pharaonis]